MYQSWQVLCDNEYYFHMTAAWSCLENTLHVNLPETTKIQYGFIVCASTYGEHLQHNMNMKYVCHIDQMSIF